MKALSTMGRAALAYAHLGWSVFPIEAGTKRPRARFVRHGHKDATRDPEQIARWWGVEPECGIGLGCAASGLVVIDVDAYKLECAFAELEARLGALPHTPRQLTPQGGTHYLFHDEVGGGYANPCAGAESKHDGYILLAPSVHPNRGIYRWDLGAHVLETPIARLPDAWLAHLTTTHAKTLGRALPSSGVDAADSWFGHAFEAEGWLGDPLRDGRRMVRCPWSHLHGDGRGVGEDSSTVLFPRSVNHTLGGFLCAHDHCKARGWRDVVEAVSKPARRRADEAMRRERNRITLEQLTSQRRAG